MNELTTIAPDKSYGLSGTRMAPGLALLFNDRLYERVKEVAKIMSGAQGFTPPHLLGKSEACFGVVQMSITWGLTPQLVAASTWATPGGKIGYEGKLVQAILENSGSLVGGVEYEEFGEWDKVMGKFTIGKSAKGHDVAKQAWKPEDEVGLGVIVSAQVRGEQERRTLKFLLVEAFPRNAVTWANRPLQQLKYTACRAFANTVMPGIFMGVPFDTDADAQMVDVTPMAPKRPASPMISSGQPSVKSDGPSPHYADGRAAFANGVGARQVPGYLSALDASAWMQGWLDASRESHEGTEEQRRSYEAEQAQADPETGEIQNNPAAVAKPAAQPEPKSEPETQPEDNGRIDIRLVASEAGEEARQAGRALAAVPDLYRRDDELGDAWQNGWRARDAKLAQGGK